MSPTVAIDPLAEGLMADVGRTAAVAADLAPGDEVLDIATGTGTAAIAAALAGARVTALDLAPSQLEVAEMRASEADVAVDWVEGDAEALPFPDASFDAVLSAIGVQFTSHPAAAARELARVVKPGGTVVLCSWTPRSFMGQLLESPAPLWGVEHHVSGLFGGSGVELSYTSRAIILEHESAGGFVDCLAKSHGPPSQARAHADLVALCEESNIALSGFRGPAEYLLAHGRKAGPR